MRSISFPENRKYGATTIFLYPNRNAISKPWPTDGKVTPEYTVSDHPNPKFSATMRVNLAASALAYVSEVPLPTTTNIV